MNDRLLRAIRREPVDRTPVWFMRQAGRYLPEYQEARAGRTFLDVSQDPEAAAEITRQPVERFPLDAAVIFSDISTPFLAAGVDYSIKKGVGPYVETPVSSGKRLDLLEPFDPREGLHFVLEEIRILRRQLDVPIVGFVGAPFTLTSYLVEAPRSKNLVGAKRFMWEEPEAWSKLQEYWSHHLAEYALAQHAAGAHVIQVFDSWAGILGVDDYREHVMPHTQSLLTRLRDAGVPTIHFYTGNPRLLPLVAEAGGDAVGVDWRCPLDDAWAAIGPRAIQGNMDPVALLAGEDVAVAKARDVLRRAAGRPGHIFNLGHGVLPDTDPDVVAAVVDAVHAYDRDRDAAGGGAR